MDAALTRRTLLVGGGAGIGLLVAWAAWPRQYRANLAAAPGEHVFGPWLKIGEDGRVIVAVPQAEEGQGSWTALAQIVADELGADWRTVGVEPAPLNPLYANPLALDSLWEGMFVRVPESARAGWARRATLELTAASTSVRMFEDACRAAGAGARALLCKAAARRWGVEWTACTAEAGFVVHGRDRLRFAALAADAARESAPDPLPIGVAGAGQLMGRPLPRLDAPAKVDGSLTFAGDVRLPDMVHARIRQGPTRASRLIGSDRAAALRITGVTDVVDGPGWVAVAAVTGRAAERGLDALAPRFADAEPLAATQTVEAALTRALHAPGHRIESVGDPDPLLAGAGVIEAEYRALPAVHAALETPTAVASLHDGRLEMWLATAAPAAARARAAAAAGVSESATVIHALPVGGGFGAALEVDAAGQAALLTTKLRRPVSLAWTRGEALLHDRCRPPMAARLSARLASNGAILGWRARIAAPATGRELAGRVIAGAYVDAVLALAPGDRYAVAGALPSYRLPAVAVDHHPAAIGVETGHLSGGAHGYTCFATESFIDELAHVANSEPLSYRIGMLGGEPRLARCLSTAAALGGWDGGVPGSGQGIACHAFRGSYVAVLAEAHLEDGRPAVDRLVVAADCGRAVNPDLVRQAIERGLVLGLATALGAATGYDRGMATHRGFDTLRLPRLADMPDITVELIRSDEAPGGAAEIGMPAVAPAIANALATTTGRRFRTLPLVVPA